MTKQSPSATFGMNKFFDVSNEEFQITHRMPIKNISEKPTSNGLAPEAPLATPCLGGGATTSNKVNAKLPTSFDWRDHSPNILTPVKNQEQCGSCWAFSMVEAIESQWALHHRTLPILSPQEVVDCSHGCSMEPPYGKVCNQGCGGGWPWNAYIDIEAIGGLDSEASYPYTAVNGNCAFNRSNVQARINNYTCISGPNTANEVTMQEILQNEGPMSICLNAGGFNYYTGGIYNPTSCDPLSLDHCVQLVGWGVSSAGEAYWTIRNSWGASWGEQGYIRMNRGANTCGVANAVSLPHVI